jgi:creatinine amidohydrolase
MPQTKFWAEMTWTDFQARDMATTIAVLPLAATEQHGPHLPLGTDPFIMEGYIARVVPRVPDELDVCVTIRQKIVAARFTVEKLMDPRS